MGAQQYTGTDDDALHGRKALPQEWIAGLLGRTGAHDDGRVLELITEAHDRFWDS